VLAATRLMASASAAAQPATIHFQERFKESRRDPRS
jgi:hypothetical protein